MDNTAAATDTNTEAATDGAPGPGFDPGRLRTVLALRRPVDDRMLAGVCTGLARYLRLDPVVVRVVLVTLSVVGGLGLVIYASVWLLTPVEGSSRAPLGRVDGHRAGTMRTVVLLVAGVLAVGAIVGPGGWWDPWPVLIVLVIIGWLVLRGREGGPPTPESSQPTTTPMPASTTTTPTTTVPLSTDPPQPPSTSAAPDGHEVPPQPPSRRSQRRDGGRLFLLGMGLVAIVVAGAWMLDRTGSDIEAPVVVAVALGVVGCCLVAGAWYGNGRPLILPALLLGSALAVTTVAPDWSVGERRIEPSAAADVASSYQLGVGRQVIDLTGVGDLVELDGRTVWVETGVGETVVTVPPGLDVTVDASVQFGELVVFGERIAEGSGGDIVTGDPDTAAPDLTVVLDNSVGRIEVERR